MSADDVFARARARWGGPPGPHRPRRPADDVWDALCAVLKWDPHPNDKATRGRLGRTVDALMAVDATPAEVRERASRYRVVMGAGVMLTPEALVKHWAACAPPARRINEKHAALEAADRELDAERVSFHEAMQRLNGAMDMRADNLSPNAPGGAG